MLTLEIETQPTLAVIEAKKAIPPKHIDAGYALWAV
jgi:hypothetical protein